MTIRALISEDNNKKAGTLKSELMTIGLLEHDIVIASNAVETRTMLREQSFNILLLDLALPNRANDTPTAEVGLEILRLILEDHEYACPDAIIGTTADHEVLEQYKGEFSRLTTQILLVSPDENDWRYSLRKNIERISLNQSRPKQHDIDVCFITALRHPELSAILSLPVDWNPETSLGNGVLVQEGSAQVNGRNLKFICAHSNQMGLVAATFMTRVLWEKYNPKLIIMTGICGGIGKSNLGDVIVAERSWDWQSGKWLNDGTFESSPDQKEATPELVALARGMNTEAVNFWKGSETRPPNKPELHVAPMVSGSAVVENVDLHDRFSSQHRKAIAVDMECYGVYFASHMSGAPNAKYICIKSVSDLANREKSDNYQDHCSQISAHIAFKIVERVFS